MRWIIPMMVVLICAGYEPWNVASAVEIRVPLLGRVKLEFQADTTSETPETERQADEDDGEQPTALSDNNKPNEPPAKAASKNAKKSKQKIDNEPPKSTEALIRAPNSSKEADKPEASPGSKQAASKRSKPTTENPKQTQQDATTVHPDDFDDSGMWDDTKTPPKEFGRQYDLDPKLLGNGLGDFQPNLQLPPNMTKDMFFKGPMNADSANQEGGDDAEGGGLFDRIKRFFSVANVREELDTIPGKIQTMMDGFRQKKADGLKNLREKMDGCAEKVRQKIAEAFSKLKKPPMSDPQKCAGQMEESFKQYEAALQGGIQPCLDKVQAVTNAREGALENAQAQFGQTLTNMQNCVSKLESSGVGSLFKSALNLGSCTKKNIQSKIEDFLQPQMKQLAEMVRQQGSKMNGNMNATGQCVERQLQLPQFQKLQQELVGKGKKCLEKSS